MQTPIFDSLFPALHALRRFPMGEYQTSWGPIAHPYAHYFSSAIAISKGLGTLVSTLAVLNDHRRYFEQWNEVRSQLEGLTATLDNHLDVCKDTFIAARGSAVKGKDEDVLNIGRSFSRHLEEVVAIPSNFVKHRNCRLAPVAMFGRSNHNRDVNIAGWYVQGVEAGDAGPSLGASIQAHKKNLYFMHYWYLRKVLVGTHVVSTALAEALGKFVPDGPEVPIAQGATDYEDDLNIAHAWTSATPLYRLQVQKTRDFCDVRWNGSRYLYIDKATGPFLEERDLGPLRVIFAITGDGVSNGVHMPNVYPRNVLTGDAS